LKGFFLTHYHFVLLTVTLRKSEAGGVGLLLDSKGQVLEKRQAATGREVSWPASHDPWYVARREHICQAFRPFAAVH